MHCLLFILFTSARAYANFHKHASEFNSLLQGRVVIDFADSLGENVRLLELVAAIKTFQECLPSVRKPASA